VIDSLPEIQAIMRDVLRREVPLTEDPEQQAIAESLVRGNERLSSTEQLNIYREQFFLRHVDSLVDDFPGVIELVGEDTFDLLARAYLRKHPPDSFSLRDLSIQFPGFLRTQTQLEHVGLAADMADFEWALLETFDAGSLPALDPAILSSLGEDDWDRAILTLDPSLKLLHLRYPVHELRPRLIDDEEVDTPELPESSGDVYLAVYRHVLRITWYPLERQAWQTLQQIQAGKPLSEALDVVAEQLCEEEVQAMTEKVGTWFSTWVQLGWLRDVTVPE
jgi:hypothetical protein